jgi:hypothetical protein
VLYFYYSALGEILTDDPEFQPLANLGDHLWKGPVALKDVFASMLNADASCRPDMSDVVTAISSECSFLGEIFDYVYSYLKKNASAKLLANILNIIQLKPANIYC